MSNKCVREKVLRLNETGKFYDISFGVDYIITYSNGDKTFHHGNSDFNGGCLFCLTYTGFDSKRGEITLSTNYCNRILFVTCHLCKDKTLCTYCLREKQNCIFRTKQKIAFWLCTKTIFPKDIRRLITKLLFKN